VPAIPEFFKFLLKIAHARIDQGKNSTYNWTVFSDSYVVTLKSDVQVEFRVLKNTFRAQAQKYHIRALRQQTQPQGRGRWGLTSNHLNPDRPEPRLWIPWKGLQFIHQVLARQDYPPLPPVTNQRKKSVQNTYPVTLCWYENPPRDNKDDETVSWSSALFPYSNNDLLADQSVSRPTSPSFSVPDSLDEEFPPLRRPRSQLPASVDAEAPSGPEATSAPSPQAATLSEQGLHKRQISEAIPREERENERTEGARIAQETPQQENEAT
jgi:hypothetical protein